MESKAFDKSISTAPREENTRSKGKQYRLIILSSINVKIFYLVLMIYFYLLILIFVMLSWEELWLIILAVIPYSLLKSSSLKSLDHSEAATKILNIVLFFLADVRNWRIDSFICWFFFSFKMIFQFASILEILDLKGTFGKKNRIKLLCII